MGAPAPADDGPRDDYRGRHRTTEESAAPALIVATVDGSDVRTKPLDGLIQAHGFAGRTDSIQI
jgi:hypothetical protein